MLSAITTAAAPESRPADLRATWSLPLLDRVAVGYLALPLALFIGGWLQLWVAIPLLACAAVCVAPLFAPASAEAEQAHPLTQAQVLIALCAGGLWTVMGGTDHLVFANADWLVRDAVLHDLVTSPWPVGYGALDGQTSVLRAPLAYFLPAAVVGKLAGLQAAHVALSLWTALGASLFLMQVMSLTSGKAATAVAAVLVIVLFSGLDIAGYLINYGARFREHWKLAMHLEWWANYYQYSSITTQLFWVPNHALGGWLATGLLYRDRRGTRFDAALPIVVVAAALWSPLTALGLAPFVLLKVFVDMRRERSWHLLHPAVWGPAMIVGLVIAAYLTMDSGSIPKGLASGAPGSTLAEEVSKKIQFFVLEAGMIGVAVLAIRRSADVWLALAILAVLPFTHFGPNNDLAMRASIPSLAVLAIRACLALLEAAPTREALTKKLVLGTLLAVGAVTPVQEFARAVTLSAWPINLQATLIGVNCGGYPPHYVARLGDGGMARFLREPHATAPGPQGPDTCNNPAVIQMIRNKLYY